jgi:cytosine/adenosine deaminase-related metal-dependent hydrolase
MDGPRLEEGTVVIRDERIIALEPRGHCTADVHLGDAAVMPGLVNAHTHLDLTGLRGLAPPGGDFTAWLRLVVKHRRSKTVGQIETDIQAGLAEVLASGTTLIGDISDKGQSWPYLAQAPLRAIVFHEILGLSKQRARSAFAEATAWLDAHPALATCRPGLSPHAPYSVRASLFRKTASLAQEKGFPLSIHLAESGAEQELLEKHQGEFVAFLEALGAWDGSGLVLGAGQVLQLNKKVPHVLFIHGNYLADPVPFPPGGTVVYCPRTHAAFGHPVHPWVRGRQGGGWKTTVRVAVGTDSLASNPDLNVLQEVRFTHARFPEIDPGQLLHAVTLSGAEALGWADQTGSLRPGKSADLVVVPLSSATTTDPYRLVLESSHPVHKVLFRGQWTRFGQPDKPRLKS